MFTWLYHIKIVDRPIKIVIFHSYVAVYQRVTPLIFSGTSHWDEKGKTPEKNRWRIIPKDAGRLHESPSQNVTPASIVCHLVIWNSYGKHLFLQGKSIHEYNWQLFIANFVTLPDGMYIYICVYIYMCVCVVCVCMCVCVSGWNQTERQIHTCVTACQPISFPLGCPFYSCMNHAIVQDSDRYIPGAECHVQCLIQSQGHDLPVLTGHDACMNRQQRLAH